MINIKYDTQLFLFDRENLGQVGKNEGKSTEFFPHTVC